jgi:acetyl-CoA C-acetyltransferase
LCIISIPFWKWLFVKLFKMAAERRSGIVLRIAVIDAALFGQSIFAWSGTSLQWRDGHKKQGVQRGLYNSPIAYLRLKKEPNRPGPAFSSDRKFMSEFVIVAAKRTAIGGFQGTLKDSSAVDLGVIATKAILAGLPAEDIADVIIGNVLQAGNGMNAGRQIALRSGLPDQAPAQTINRVCGSGLQAVVSAVQGLQCGEGKLYLAGGTESMSRAPYLLPQARSGYRYGSAELVDSILSEGLTDPILRYAMGITAENLAEQLGITREEQDAFALESQARAANAQKGGVFCPEIVPVPIKTKQGIVEFTADEHLRPDSTLERLAKLKPAFKETGTVTAGNSSGLNDGAAMLAVTTGEYAKSYGLPVLARILSYGLAGTSPTVMGLGPVAAVLIALKKAGLTLGQIDLFELNEAFAAQAIAVVRKLSLDPARVNVSGGAIALGHPIGASGARVLVTLIHSLRRLEKRYGVASLCIGGGMGIAIVISAE